MTDLHDNPIEFGSSLFESVGAFLGPRMRSSALNTFLAGLRAISRAVSPASDRGPSPFEHGNCSIAQSSNGRCRVKRSPSSFSDGRSQYQSSLQSP